MQKVGLTVKSKQDIDSAPGVPSTQTVHHYSFFQIIIAGPLPEMTIQDGTFYSPPGRNLISMKSGKKKQDFHADINSRNLKF